MWIDRPSKKRKFINNFLELRGQALVLRGPRQVGKTSFILNALKELPEYPKLMLNVMYPTSFKVGGDEYLGRDFFGASPTGEDLLKNIEREIGDIKNLARPILVFIDEADRHPIVLESIQTLAEFSHNMKFVLTGSNLENIPVKNAATGRKKFFDLYPITFEEFVAAGENEKLVRYMNELSLKNYIHSDFAHNKLKELFSSYLRLGGMPKILDTYLAPSTSQPISEVIKDLTFSIEENVKTVLGEKSKLYEYDDVLRKMACLSMNTLKYSNLQVQHAGRSEAKRLVAKTVGSRVVHKIRLFDSKNDLSKYIIFDCGILNYLLSGADLLKNAIGDRNMAIMHETFVGSELIARMTTRDDLFYWKSGNTAEIEYILRSPSLVGIDVKTGRGDCKSLNSFALLEKDAHCLVKISDAQLSIDREHAAFLPNTDHRRKIPLMTVPHYISYRLHELLGEV
ncbi:MAG: AAA family ATPase [Pseudomonadota bacterium]